MSLTPIAVVPDIIIDLRLKRSEPAHSKLPVQTDEKRLHFGAISTYLSSSAFYDHHPITAAIHPRHSRSLHRMEQRGARHASLVSAVWGTSGSGA